MVMPCLVWFRSDLRTNDHPALEAATLGGGAVIPVFIWSPEEEESWAPGSASRWWLHHSLDTLASALADQGSRLVLRRGPALATLLELIRETGATRVVWNRRYEPAGRALDSVIKTALRGMGVRVDSFPGAVLHEPFTIRNRADQPFQVFTPFYKHYQALGPISAPLPAPSAWSSPSVWPASLPLATFELLPERAWADGFKAMWQPGSVGAELAVAGWLSGGLPEYANRRDYPGDIDGVSRLAAHLRFGEVSPRQLWWEVARKVGSPGWQGSGAAWLRQLVWRDFAQHLLFHFPHTPGQPLRADFEQFPWISDAQALRCWQRGRTGYPLVDAGMRQLWRTGYMHNRVRMVVASFLVKHLLIDWREGARWFWDTLLDADLANNTLGWQWSAGCGADAAPYFRIFNPLLQAQRFDPAGDYIRTWVPELAALSAPDIHAPHEAPEASLRSAGIRLGKDYPLPMIEHKTARARALAALRSMNGMSGRDP